MIDVGVLYRRGKTNYLVKFKGVYYVINIFTKQTHTLENEDQFLALGYAKKVNPKELNEIIQKLMDILGGR